MLPGLHPEPLSVRVLPVASVVDAEDVLMCCVHTLLCVLS